MSEVHVFASRGRFSSERELGEFIDATYTEDGDRIDSLFIKEVGLSSYEPACIEATFSTQERELHKLLEGSSYSELWLDTVPNTDVYNSVISVFEPNELETPQDTSLTYVGCFEYEE